MYQVEDIPLDLLDDNPYDQRKKVGDIESLAESIKERGLQNPITVIKIENRYIIAHGHRRTYAFRYLKRKTIPAFVRKESTPDNLMIDLAIENFQRKDLLPTEKGATIEQLFYTIPNVQNNVNRVISLISQLKCYGRQDNIGEGFTEDDIFRTKKLLGLIGISESMAMVYLRLLSLPEDMQKNIVLAGNQTFPDGTMTIRSAYELTRISDQEAQKQLYDKVIKERTPYKQVRHMVNNLIDNNEKVARISKTGSVKKKTNYDADAEKLTEDLFSMSSRIESFRTKKLPFVYGDLEKVQWKASLDKMKKACLETVTNINGLINEDLKIEGLLEIVNVDLQVVIKHEMRYRFPNRVTEILKAKEGDILLLKVEGVRRLPSKLEDIETTIVTEGNDTKENKEGYCANRISTS